MSGLPIRFEQVTKRFGPVTAVSDLSFTVEPGRVTGFLGPNGAGKTTSLRILLGLVAPTSGRALVGNTPYDRLDRPLHTVGAALEAASFHPGRSARDHLRVYATAAGVDRRRVGAVLEQVGLTAYADRRVGGYSLGMRQRLGLAHALLGDPGVLVLDEPVNGLDPEGIRWIRTFLRELAQEGRTVLVSSHLLSEVQQSVDDVVILARGRLVHRGSLADLAPTPAVSTVVESPDAAALDVALRDAGLRAERQTDGVLVQGVEPAEVGRIALRAGVPLSGLRRGESALEDSFLALIGGTDAGGGDAGAASGEVRA